METDAILGQVTILMGLFNGAQMVGPQLESYAGQTHENWRLIVSDDGSGDDGPDLVERFATSAQATGREVRLIKGPCAGLGRNYLSLLRLAGSDTPFVALSDQDDVWLPDKLARALKRLAQVPPGVPALYGGRTVICDGNMAQLRMSPLFHRPPSFRNALVQSIAGANTMVLNRAALDVVQAAAAEAHDIVVHDWWLYQVISGVGGEVNYDPEPSVLYRQHCNNQIGANDTMGASLNRMALLARGRFRRWNDVNIAALTASAHRFTPENRAALEGFARMRAARMPRRLAAFAHLGLYRQTAKGQAALWLAVALGLL